MEAARSLRVRCCCALSSVRYNPLRRRTVRTPNLIARNEQWKPIFLVLATAAAVVSLRSEIHSKRQLCRSAYDAARHARLRCAAVPMLCVRWPSRCDAMHRHVFSFRVLPCRILCSWAQPRCVHHAIRDACAAAILAACSQRQTQFSVLTLA